MWGWHLVTGIAGQHIIPSLFACALVYLALCLLFGPGQLRRPADRVAFLYAALLKAAFALWAGTGISCLAPHPEMAGFFGIRLPKMVPQGIPFEPHDLAAVPVISQVASRVLLGGLALALVLLCLRWVRLAPVYRAIHQGRRVEDREIPAVFRVFDELATKTYRGRTWLARPRLLVMWDAPCPAFTMGVRPPVVVLSAELAEELALRELRGILAHELAHCRRLDYIGRWVATVLRDIMMWNPLVVLWHNQLVEEQERASDEYAAELLEDPVAVASGLVEMGAHAYRLPLVSVGPLTVWRRDRDLRSLRERLDRLATSILSRRSRSRWAARLVGLALVVFLAAQPQASLSLPNLYALVKGIL